jgi:hypothetical protein
MEITKTLLLVNHAIAGDLTGPTTILLYVMGNGDEMPPQCVSIPISQMRKIVETYEPSLFPERYADDKEDCDGDDRAGADRPDQS